METEDTPDITGFLGTETDEHIEIGEPILEDNKKFFYCPRKNCVSAKLQLLYFDSDTNIFGMVCNSCGQFQEIQIPLQLTKIKPRIRNKKINPPSYT